MSQSLSRRYFLAATAGSAIGTGLFSKVGVAQSDSTPSRESSGEDTGLEAFPRQSPSLVQETVGASHGRFERVRELVAAYPELAKSSWDWGFGDWEAPIEAASHTGQREIAHFLIDHGARPNLFTFAMLGDLGVVKSLLEVQPELRKATGPHGLSLLHHARVGGEKSAEVRRYLETLGDADAGGTAASKEMADALSGVYATDGPHAKKFQILLNKQGLAVQGEGGISRNLFQLADGVLHPSGAPSVRFRFELVEGKAQSASLMMGGRTYQATRIP